MNWWLRWLEAEGELKAEAAAQVPRWPERVLDVLSREEIQELPPAPPCYPIEGAAGAASS